MLHWTLPTTPRPGGVIRLGLTSVSAMASKLSGFRGMNSGSESFEPKCSWPGKLPKPPGQDLTCRSFQKSSIEQKLRSPRSMKVFRTMSGDGYSYSGKNSFGARLPARLLGVSSLPAEVLGVFSLWAEVLRDRAPGLLHGRGACSSNMEVVEPLTTAIAWC